MHNERGGILSKLLTIPAGVAILVAFFFLGDYLGKQQGRSDSEAQRLGSLPDIANQYLPKKEDLTFYKTLTEKAETTTTAPVPPKPEAVKPPPKKAEEAPAKKKEAKRPEITITRVPEEPSTKSAPDGKKAPETAATSTPKGRYTVQIASYPDRELAEDEVRRMKKMGYAAFVVASEVPDRGTWYRVRLGSFQKKASADKLAREVQAKAGLAPLVTAE